jgi:hypothetical protein
LGRKQAAGRKAAFVNIGKGFVNRASALPGFPVLPASALVAIGLATVVGAFGTGQMPLPTRLGFWTALIGLNALLWQAWFAVTVRGPDDWNRSALIGGILLNLPLPFEIGLLLRAFGVSARIDPVGGWAKALAISALILAIAIVARRSLRRDPIPATIKPGGLLARAGAPSPDAVHAIGSEDHYCRVHLSDGRAPLIHHRFRDALDEVAGCDGFQVHRSHWVASAGVVGAERSGRAWRLTLADGSKVPVSARCIPEARARGWLARGSRDAVALNLS